MLRPSLPTVKTYKVFVFGAKGCGKTSIIHQALYSKKAKYPSQQLYEETIEDVYSAVVDNDRGGKERINFFDTAGIALNFNCDSIKNYVLCADGLLLVYAINDKESFLIAEQIKRAIDKLKEKKEIPIVCIANKLDKFRERKVDADEAMHWAHKERVKLFEVSATERKTLIEPLIHIASKLNPPQNKSAFPQLGRKAKGASNITMEL
ncbi:NF-kappa-B inhibitor-interacting Ras-like protein 1 [Dinothrombium tinctorium]|uniref:NF-kappa-B inhibitor-interacting Ras-like protein 1 n=1 Tax=Dinothrombium tinctorium TaxID=1965070 RepID=A0A3S3RT25_9ACAR|nr:NF-kappa-B inhibitor-interacting Ras-like protein 1 [Dinothrombium tinctorium]